MLSIKCLLRNYIEGITVMYYATFQEGQLLNGGIITSLPAANDETTRSEELPE